MLHDVLLPGTKNEDFTEIGVPRGFSVVSSKAQAAPRHASGAPGNTGGRCNFISDGSAEACCGWW